MKISVTVGSAVFFYSYLFSSVFQIGFEVKLGNCLGLVVTVRNRNGGCFSYKITNKYVATIWKTLFYLLAGSNLCIKKEHNQYINGITISPKKNFCIIKIWLCVAHLQDPSIITEIPNLTIQGCLFKKHEPEY